MLSKKIIKDKNTKFIITAILVFWVITVTHSLNLFERVENRLYDLGFRHKKDLRIEHHLITIDIDDPAITTVGRWPWSWSIHKYIFEFLDMHNARHIIATDIDFSKMPNVSIPKQEAKTIRVSSGQETVALISEIVSEKRPDNLIKTLQEIGDNIYLTAPVTTKSETAQNTYILNEDLSYYLKNEALPIPSKNAMQAISITPPLKILQERVYGVGLNVFTPDADGTVRRYPLLFRYENTAYPSIALKVAMDLGGFKEVKIIDNHISLVSDKKTLLIPHDSYGQILINWAGDYEGSFTHIPFNLLSSYIVLQRLKDSLKGVKIETTPDINQIHASLIALANRVGLLKQNEAENLATITFLSFLMEYYFTHTPYSIDEVLESLGLDVNNPDFYALAKKIYINNLLAREISKKGTVDVEKIITESKISFKQEDISYHNYCVRLLLLYANKKGLLDRVRPLYFEGPKELTIGNKRLSIDPTFFDNKTVFYGLTATGLTSQNPTPVMQRHPMLDIPLQAVNTIITENFIKEIPFYTQIILIIIYVCLAVLFGIRFTPIVGTCLLLLLISLHLTIAWFSFQTKNLMIPISPFVITLLGGYCLTIFLRYFEEYKERKMVKDLFSTMVSPEVLRMLQDKKDAVSLTGEIRDATIFSSDVSGFTTISEGVTAQELSKILNIYLTAMSNVIMSFDGYIDKYEGDAIKAGFGVPLQDSNHPWKACYAALMQQQELKIVKHMILMKYGVEITARMGINTGEVYAGKMGSEKRLQYTFMGEAVHIAEELEPINKIFNTWIAISHQTMQRSGDYISSRFLGEVEIGLEKIRVYELLAWNRDKFKSFFYDRPIPELLLQNVCKLTPERVIATMKYYKEIGIHDSPLLVDIIVFLEKIKDTALQALRLDIDQLVIQTKRQMELLSKELGIKQPHYASAHETVRGWKEIIGLAVKQAEISLNIEGIEKSVESINKRLNLKSSNDEFLILLSDYLNTTIMDKGNIDYDTDSISSNRYEIESKIKNSGKELEHIIKQRKHEYIDLVSQTI
ncbi:MAG: adenylate/guanylate cyclase domain-containing protein [Thermodesulfovibrionales bacterium]|nr:adenylate/guanylate cyclase domain-containing protein [Thermodesulfovibrionales bacterium]